MRGGQGWGLRLYGGTATLTNRSIAGISTGAYGQGGTWIADTTTVIGELSGLGLYGGGASTVPSTATLTNSFISGEIGANVSDGTLLSVSATRIAGSDYGIGLSNADISVRNGSTVHGVNQAISLRGGSGNPNQVEIEGSQIISDTGPAIWAQNTAFADIYVRNGSVISAGNGVLVDISRGLVNFNVAASVLTGDIVAGEEAIVNTSLTDGALFNGTISNGGSVSLADSAWRLAGHRDMRQPPVRPYAPGEPSDGTAFSPSTIGGN